MRKPRAFLFSTLAIATVMLPALAGTASSAPVPNDDDLTRYLLRVPLPDDDSDLQVITPAKYQKLSEAFCTKDTLSVEQLKKIDKVYKNALPVTFGTPDAPTDPIGEARLEVLGTAELTNGARNKLCKNENPDVRADYYKALVLQIKKAGTTPIPAVQEGESTAEDIWNMRLTGFKAAFGNLLSANDI